MTSRKTIVSMFLVAAVVSALAVGGAMAAVPSIDTSTSDDTSTTSEIRDAGVVNVTANDSTVHELEFKVDSDNPKVVLEEPEGETETIATFTPSDDEVTQLAYNSTSGTYYYQVNVTNSDLRRAEMAQGGAADIGVKIINNTAVSSPDEKFILFTADAQNGTGASPFTQETIDSGAAGVETTYLVNLESINYTMGEEQVATLNDRINLTFNSNGNTHHYVHLGDSDAASAFDNDASNVKDGEWITGATVTLTNANNSEVHFAKMYKNSAPSDTRDVYAVYHTDTDTIEVVGSNNTLKSTEYDMTVSSSSADFGTLQEELGITQALKAFSPL